VLVQTPSGNERVTLGLVVVTSILPVLVAAALFAVRRRSARHPARTFWRIGIVVLVVSLVLPISITDVPLNMALTLSLMHVVAATVALGVLTRMSRAAPSGGVA
jgi:heme A synthase